MTSAPTPAANPSREALSTFRARIDRHKIWSGAQIGLVGVREADHFVLFFLRVTLVTEGAERPEPDRFFEAKTEHVLVRSFSISIADLWPLLDEVTESKAGVLSSLVGETIVVHESSRGHNWYTNTDRYSKPNGVTIQLAKGGQKGFHEMFGHPMFEAAQTSLRNHDKPYSSLTEIVQAMNFTSGVGDVSNSANPRFEIGAQMPLTLVAASYKRLLRGIEIQVSAGASVPRDRIRISVMPEPRQLICGTDCETSTKGEFRLLRFLLPCPRPAHDLTVSLQFDDLPFGEERIRAPAKKTKLFIGASIEQRWEAELRAEFEMSPDELGARIRRAIPKKAGGALKVAEARIRDAILLRKEFPFYAIVAAGSVAEFVLKEQLRRAPKTDVEAAAAAIGVKLENGRKRWKMSFDEATKLCEHLGLLRKLDRSAIDVLRNARNHVHFNREKPPTKLDFTGARAMASIVVMLDLLGRR